MGFFDDLGKNVGILSQEAKKTYDAKKLERRIKSYRKEETELYTKLGRLLYQARGEAFDEGRFAAIYDNLDAIKARMRHLDKQITDIRSKSEDDYLQLSRKESDLRITRTSEGIRLIRLCTECGTANSQDDKQCVQCQHQFE